MRSSWRLVGGLVVVGAVALGIACGGARDDGGGSIPDAGSGSGKGPGSDAGAPDSGAPDAGAPDAGPPDAGPPDAGGLKTISFPHTANWDFYGPQNGGPQDVRDAAVDEGGNLWVAGGSEGVFLMRVDASGKLSGKFEKFGIADGLHPYGWLNGEAAQGMGVKDGTPADAHPSLDATPVISVAGGPAGTVFVGYQGKDHCEDAWHGDQWTPPSSWGDPSVYKSGDADRVTLTGSGISVVHYDIFSGPGVVGGEIKGREKICSVYRLAWDKANNQIWFGGNHGFAGGKADAANAPTCNGEPGCPVIEHSHPAISGCSVNYDYATGSCPSNKVQWLTDSYAGLAVDPRSHDLWVGGANRTTLFRSATLGGFQNAADSQAELPPSKGGMAYRWDLWPDLVSEWDPSRSDPTVYVMPAQRVDDAVSGIVAAGDDTAWVSSYAHGLIHIDSSGTRLADATASLSAKFITALARDPFDGSLWASIDWGFGGVSRVTSGGAPLAKYGKETFGDVLFAAPVVSVSAGGSGSARSMVAGFRANAGYAGAIAVYKGP